MTEYKLNPADLSAAAARTAEWQVQRETCDRCANCLTNIGRTGERIMVCSAIPASGMSYGAYCIDAREIGQRCGPNANLFQPKE
jgi:hypothetical protein